MERLRIFLKLMRPRHTFQIVGIVAILSFASHGLSVQSVLAVASSLFLSISVFLLDDAYDLESDRLVHPQRPIPRGIVKQWQAYLGSAIFLLLATLFSATLPLYQLTLFLALTILAVAIVLLNVKSIFRAFLTASLIWTLFPYGAYLDLKVGLFGLIVALPHVGGTIAKDIIHSQGDMTQGLKPPPDWSRYLASFTFFSSGIILWVPVILDLVLWPYVLPITATCLSCIILGISMLKNRYGRVYAIGGVGMFSALIAFLLGGL